MIQKFRKSNKGFTLVELIVVIAILGVLAAILVPQYTGYVERSRQGVDISYIGEVAHNVAVETAAIEGSASTQYNITFTTGGAYSITSGTGASPTAETALTNEVKKIVNETTFRSTRFSHTAPGVITVINGTVGTLPTANNG